MHIQVRYRMNVQNSEPGTIWHLEMLHPEELCARALPPETQLVKQEIPLPDLYRFFYLEVASYGNGRIVSCGLKNSGGTG